MRRMHYKTYNNKYKMIRANMDKNFNQKGDKFTIVFSCPA